MIKTNDLLIDRKQYNINNAGTTLNKLHVKQNKRTMLINLSYAIVHYNYIKNN